MLEEMIGTADIPRHGRHITRRNMFLKMESGALINVDLVDTVEFDKFHEKASLFAGGVLLYAESKIAHRYFSNPELLIKLEE